MNDELIRSAGTQLAEAWLKAEPLNAFPAHLRAQTREQAIAVQDVMAEVIAQPVSAWKLGATSPVMRERAGHDGAIIGRVFDSVTFYSPAQLRASRFRHARVECEFAFKVLAPIHAKKDGWQEQDLLERVVLHSALEIIGNRYPHDPSAFKPNTNDEIADNGAGIGFVFGPPIKDWRDHDLSNLVIDIRVDGLAPAENFLGDGRCPPLHSLVQATQMLGLRGIDIEPGQYVSTGAATDPQPLTATSKVVADFGGLARIDTEFIDC